MSDQSKFSTIVDIRVASASSLSIRSGSVILEVHSKGNSSCSSPKSSLDGWTVFNTWLRVIDPGQWTTIRIVKVNRGASGGLDVACHNIVGFACLDSDLAKHHIGEGFVRKVVRIWESKEAAIQAGKDRYIDENEACPWRKPRLVIWCSIKRMEKNLVRPEMEYEVPIARLNSGAQIYAHGGFMACAVSMICDPKWRGILDELQNFGKEWKSYFSGCRKGVQIRSLMATLENSPVLCAYGLVRMGCTQDLLLRGSTSTSGCLTWEEHVKTEKKLLKKSSSRFSAKAVALLSKHSQLNLHGGLQGNCRLEDVQETKGLVGGIKTLLHKGLERLGKSVDTAQATQLRKFAEEEADTSPHPSRVSAAELMGVVVARECSGDVGSELSPRGSADKWLEIDERDQEMYTREFGMCFGGSQCGCGETACQAVMLEYREIGAEMLLENRHGRQFSQDSIGGSMPSTSRSKTHRNDSGTIPKGIYGSSFNSSTKPPGINGSTGNFPNSTQVVHGGSSSFASTMSVPDSLERFSQGSVPVELKRRSSWEKQASLALRTESFRPGVSRHGYKPVALEWDIWLNPRDPWDLAKGTVDHGSAKALLKQSLYTMLGLRSWAILAGESQIDSKGIPPMEWLTIFGKAINKGLADDGSDGTALPLHAPIGFTHRLSISASLIESGALWITMCTSMIVTFSVTQHEWPLPDKRLLLTRLHTHKMADFSGDSVKIGPISPGETMGDLVIEVVAVLAVPDNGNRRAKVAELKIPIKQLTGDGKTSKHTIAINEPMVSPRCTKGNVDGDMIEKLDIEFSCEAIDYLAAAEEHKIPRAAAQTCVAMLSDPGGLYLDVKSAYSKAIDIQYFVSSMRSLGITVKGIGSFVPMQLETSQCPTFLFFHGLAGLENALDDGIVPRDQNVLFNGSSFLLEKISPATTNEQYESYNWTALIDSVNMNKYEAIASAYRFAGGIYIQETDAGPVAIDALTHLVNENPQLFPLGFAYGHIPGKAMSILDVSGRGFASQQVLEELQARKLLSQKVKARVLKKKNQNMTAKTVVVWAQRLLDGRRILCKKDQIVFISLLAGFWPHQMLPSIVNQLGGIERIFLRFFEHYEVISPYTLLESGFNYNHTKDLLRLFRDRGVIAALPIEKKIDLVRFFRSSAAYGYGLTYVLQLRGIRLGLHKFAKEGLMCVFESCTQAEVQQLYDSIGSLYIFKKELTGRLRLSFHYIRRLISVKNLHAKHPSVPAYRQEDAKYRALGHRGGPVKADEVSVSRWDYNVLHTRDKSVIKRMQKLVRKVLCCCFSLGYTTAFSLVTFGSWFFVCIPRGIVPILPNSFRCGLGMSIASAVLPLLGLLALAVIVILMLSGSLEIHIFHNSSDNHELDSANAY